jgi:hypothetical protein
MTKQQQIEAIQIVGAMILASIPNDGKPSGHIYASLCGKVSLDQYQTILSHLKQRNVVNEESHFLTRGENFEKTYSLLKKAVGL